MSVGVCWECKKLVCSGFAGWVVPVVGEGCWVLLCEDCFRSGEDDCDEVVVDLDKV